MTTEQQMFYEFLIREGILFDYLSNVPSLGWVFEKHDPRAYIEMSFVWDDSIEGIPYWSLINRKWVSMWQMYQLSKAC
jgi:hypothetical protein